MNPKYLTPGLRVMVKSGADDLQVVFLAVVCEQIETTDDIVRDPSERDPAFLLDVFVSPGVLLPQRYRASEILGVPATGLDMPKVEVPPKPKRRPAATADPAPESQQ